MRPCVKQTKSQNNQQLQNRGGGKRKGEGGGEERGRERENKVEDEQLYNALQPFPVCGFSSRGCMRFTSTSTSQSSLGSQDVRDFTQLHYVELKKVHLGLHLLSNPRMFRGTAQALGPVHFWPREDCVSECWWGSQALENVLSGKAWSWSVSTADCEQEHQNLGSTKLNIIWSSVPC